MRGGLLLKFKFHGGNVNGKDRVGVILYNNLEYGVSVPIVMSAKRDSH